MLKTIKYIPIIVLLGFLVFAGFVLVGNTGPVKAAESANVTQTSADSGKKLDCHLCHSKVVLDYHDTLGPGNNACWTCHDPYDMTQLHLVDGTLIPLNDAPQLCGKCHEQRYNEWKVGTHGLPDFQTTCVYCHDPHQPQVNLTGITLPHPDPAPPPPPVPVNLVMIIVITLIVIGVIYFIALRRQRVE